MHHPAQSRRWNWLGLVALGLAACATSQVAAADQLFLDAAPPPLTNVLANCAANTGPGTSVSGCTGTEVVTLSSIESLTYSGGAATLEGTGNTVQNPNPLSTFSVSMAAPGSLLSTVQFNIEATSAVPGTTSWVRFSDGVAGDMTGYFALTSNGSNIFTLSDAVPFDTLTVTTFALSGNAYVQTDLIQDVKQIRLGQATAVPEPQTYSMTLAGLSALVLLMRRRRNGIS